MKQIVYAFTLLLISNFVYGQSENDDKSRFISVTGSAEVIVAPDEIELEIILKEYNPQGSKKYRLSVVESKFLDILAKNNIDKKSILFGGSNYYWYYWWSYRNANYKQKTYKIKLNSSTDFLSLMKDLNFKGVYSLRISNTSNEHLQELRKDIKISALKAAKDKAIYLLDSIDEKLGCVISIEEVPENQNYYWRGTQNVMSNAVVSSNSSDSDIENVASIKLRYEVKAKFSIE